MQTNYYFSAPQSANITSELISQMARLAKAPIEWLRSYYSACLDRELNSHQTWCLVHAQVAFLFAAFAECSLPLHVLTAAWFGWSLWRCKQAL